MDDALRSQSAWSCKNLLKSFSTACIQPGFVLVSKLNVCFIIINCQSELVEDESEYETLRQAQEDIRTFDPILKKSISNIAKQYINRFQTFEQLFDIPILPNCGLIVVIPCYNEPNILHILTSLKECDLPACSVEVSVFINASETDDNTIKNFNEESYEQVRQFCIGNSTKAIQFLVALNNELPKKHAGVGLARKMLMDDALQRFASINKDGFIANTDADCTVSKNYLTEIYNTVTQSNAQAGCVHFEHPYARAENETIKQAIIEYEIHLRYYIQAMRYAGYPNTYHTIGSTMLCRASAYAEEGGMNKLKAAEDFYFINKLARTKKFVEIHKATVYPSCRISNRVPFGTGRAMLDLLTGKTSKIQTYDFQCFEILKQFLSLKKEIATKDINTIDFIHKYNLTEYQKQQGIEKFQQEIKKQGYNDKRFFYWFSHLKALKFIHYLTENYFPKVSVLEATEQLFEAQNLEPNGGLVGRLEQLRNLDKDFC